MTKMKEKLLQKSTMKVLKEHLFRWSCETLATSNNLDRDLLREKAITLTKTLGLSDFKCSNAWVRNFLREHKISADTTNQPDPVFKNYRDWIDMMRSTIVKYKHRDLFHVDELGMYSNVPPSRISSTSRVEGDGSSQNRITILMGCNSTGTTKLPLLICGPYPSRTTTRDHVYCRSEDSSISDKLFRDWLTAVNNRVSRCNRNILLFLRRSRARAVHDLQLSHVNLVYLPKDFPPTLRPLRRDVFHYVKMIFRRRYAGRLKRRTTEWNLRDILESLIEAWEMVPREIVICSFQRTHFRTDDRFLQIDCDSWDSLQTGISFKRFVTFDDDLSDEPIVSSRYHSYNLRTIHNDVVQINEDNEEQYKSVDSNDHVAVNHDQNPSDEHQNRKRQTRLSENPADEVEARTLGSRSSGETQFPEKKQDVNDGIMNNEAFKRDTLLLGEHQTESTNINNSVQAIIDKALTLTTTAKADYARKLIDSIYASNQEAQKSNNETLKDSNETEKPSSSLVTCKSDQTSISFNQEDMLSEMVMQSSLETTEEACTSGETDKTNASDAKQRIPDENDKLTSDVQQDILEPASRKRRMSPSSNDSGDDTDEAVKKKLKTDGDWSKQFETTFVFGPPDSVECSPRCELDGNIVVSCTINTAHSVSPRN